MKAVLLSVVALFQVAGAMAQDGVLDPTFANGGRNEFVPVEAQARGFRLNAIQALSDGKLLAAGYIDNALPLPWAEPNTRIAIARMDVDGRPDASFGNAPEYPGVMIFGDISVGSRMQEARAIAVLRDGSAIVGGLLDSWVFGGFTLRIGPDGVLDAAYGDGGVSLHPFQVLDIAADSRGRIVVAGDSRDAVPAYHGVVARIDASTAALDASFGSDGIVDLLEFADDGTVLDHQGGLRAIAVTAGDAVVVAGFQQGADTPLAWSVAKLVDGEFDPSFAGGGWSRFVPGWAPASSGSILSDIAIDASGAIVLAGEYEDELFHRFPVLARLGADGAADPTFGEAAYPGFRRLDVRAGFTDQRATGLALQRDGSAVFTAAAAGGQQPSVPVVGRLDAQGRADATFGSDGISLFDMPPDSVFADAVGIAMQGDRPLIVAVDGRRADAESPMYVRALVMRLTGDRVFSDRFEEE